MRDDTVVPSLPREASLAAAPDADPAAGLFKVPRVMG
jgi:Asp-tRNA(Asn)/Glu-tRNA(Gln) amidotransferase C subunit